MNPVQCSSLDLTAAVASAAPFVCSIANPAVGAAGATAISAAAAAAAAAPAAGCQHHRSRLLFTCLLPPASCLLPLAACACLLPPLSCLLLFTLYFRLHLLRAVNGHSDCTHIIELFVSCSGIYSSIRTVGVFLNPISNYIKSTEATPGIGTRPAPQVL